MRKLLYSSGFDSWSHFAPENQKDFMLFYKPLIEAIESGDKDKIKKARLQFLNDFEEKFSQFCLYEEFNSLRVYTIPDDSKFFIYEYDGSESVVLESDIIWR
jgi:hypothetical protein